jgi:hypothetical protein
MTDSAPSLRSRIKSDLIALASLSFMAGSFAITAAVLVRSDRLGWVYAATAVTASVALSSWGAEYFREYPSGTHVMQGLSLCGTKRCRLP